VSIETLEVRPFSKPRHVLDACGNILAVPVGWSLLPPGDAALSRRIKQGGPIWTMIEVKGRKRFSRGIWAPTDRIETLKAELLIERRDPSYQRKLDSGRKRRAAEQEVYAGDFRSAVLACLDFHPIHAEKAEVLSRLIADHAVPVGSGTVARTERIPIDQRAAAAIVAWMRHQTTGYDRMHIPPVKGKRREVRRVLAQHSVQLLKHYRQGRVIDEDSCPLAQALKRFSPAVIPAAPKTAVPVQGSLF